MHLQKDVTENKKLQADFWEKISEKSRQKGQSGF